MTRRPRIVLGVTSVVSLRLLEGAPAYLAEHGWDVHVVSAPGPGLDDVARSNVAVHAIRLARDPSPRDVLGLIAWVRLLRRLRPDVVVAGTPKAGLVGMIAARVAHVPGRVYLLRGLRLETTRGLGRRVLLAAERVAARAAHRVLAVSSSLAVRTVDLGIAPAEKVTVLGAGSSNGVDLERARRGALDPPTLDLPDGLPVVGYVGRLTPAKGLHVLAEAHAILRERGLPHALLIVGDGERPVAAFDSDERWPVLFTGKVADVERYYPTMAVLALPTFREGFPNVVLEAAAAGVPTVTTDATGAVDSVVNGVTGRVVPVRDAVAFADALEELLGDSTVRQRMGAAARHRAESDYSRESVWAAQHRFFSALVPGALL